METPAELLAINPRGQVPVPVDGELSLFDSTVIVEYLDERHPVPPLFPRGIAARARARLFEEYGDGLMNGCIADLLAETYRKPDRSSWTEDGDVRREVEKRACPRALLAGVSRLLDERPR